MIGHIGIQRGAPQRCLRLILAGISLGACVGDDRAAGPEDPPPESGSTTLEGTTTTTTTTTTTGETTTSSMTTMTTTTTTTTTTTGSPPMCLPTLGGSTWQSAYDVGDLLCMEDSMVMFHDEVENNEGPFWYHIDSGSCDPTLAYIFDLVATRLPAGAPPTSDPFCVVIACPGVDLAECSGTSTTTAGPPGSAMCCTDNNAVDALELKIGCSDDTPPAYDVYVRAEYSGEACRDADFTIEAKNFLAL